MYYTMAKGRSVSFSFLVIVRMIRNGGEVQGDIGTVTSTITHTHTHTDTHTQTRTTYEHRIWISSQRSIGGGLGGWHGLTSGKGAKGWSTRKLRSCSVAKLCINYFDAWNRTNKATVWEEVVFWVPAYMNAILALCRARDFLFALLVEPEATPLLPSDSASPRRDVVADGDDAAPEDHYTSNSLEVAGIQA